MATSEQTIPSQTPERGEPDSPLDLPAPDWKASIKQAAKQFKEDRGTLVSAGMAFYWFLAVFPALLAAVGITALFNLSQGTIASIGRGVQAAMPGDAARVITDALKQASGRTGGASVAAALIGIVLALWAASAGMVATEQGLNVVYETEDPPFVKKRVRALGLLALAAVLGGIATAAIVFGPAIGGGLRDHLPFGGGVLFTLVWTIVRWVVGLGALISLFAAFYFLAPNREEPRWTWISPGGILATVIWLLASIGFSLYVRHLGSYAKTYGSLTGVVVLMLWLYLAAIAVILGGELNAELERQAEKQRRGRRPAGRQPRAEQPRPSPSPSQSPSQSPEAANGRNSESNEERWLEMMRQRW